MLPIELTCVDLVETGSLCNRGNVVEDGKLKLQVEPHQTIEHLKRMIANATTGVVYPFELQEHGTKKPAVYDYDKTLSDCGLVSGSVVCIPAELLDIFFVVPPGMYCCQYP